MRRQRSNCAAFTLKLGFGKDYIGRTMVVMFLIVGSTLGNMYLTNWYPVLLTNLGYDLSLVLTAGAIGMLGIPFGNIFASFVSDKGGRKGPIAIGFILLGITLFVMGMSPTPMVYTIGSVIKAVLAGGCTAMVWTYMAESFPTSIRSTMSGALQSISRALTAMSMASIPLIFTSSGYLGLHIVNRLFFVIPGVLVLFFGASTANKSLEELEIGPDKNLSA